MVLRNTHKRGFEYGYGNFKRIWPASANLWRVCGFVYNLEEFFLCLDWAEPLEIFGVASKTIATYKGECAFFLFSAIGAILEPTSFPGWLPGGRGVKGGMCAASDNGGAHTQVQ